MTRILMSRCDICGESREVVITSGSSVDSFEGRPFVKSIGRRDLCEPCEQRALDAVMQEEMDRTPT